MHQVPRILSFLSAVFLAAAPSLPAQNSASSEADVDTKVVAGVALSKTHDMQFGSVVRSAKGGKVTIDPNTDEISYDGVTHGQSTTFSAAAFESTGEPDYSYSVSLPGKVALSRREGRQTLTVTDFTCTDKTGRLNNKGSEGFKVGATLEVGSNQETGAYSGSFTIMVEYQ